METEKKMTGFASIDKPWLKYYTEEAINAPLPECTIYEYLWENNKDHLDDVALIYFGKKITYGELFKNIDKTARAFSAIGVKNGDMVAICSVATPELIYSMYALNRLGAAANILEPRNNAERILDYLILTDSKYMVMIDRCCPKIDSIVKDSPLEKVIVISPTETANLVTKIGAAFKSEKVKCNKKQYIGWKNFLKLSADYTDTTYEKDKAAIVIYTGGTTGIPKGVLLSNDAMNTVVYNMSNLDDLFKRHKKFLNIMPPFIAYGITCGIHMPLVCGMAVTVISNFIPEKLTDLILKHRPNSMMGVPAHYDIVSKNPRMKNKDLSFLECCGAGGDAFNPSIEKSVNEFLLSHNAPYKVSKGYGMTEACSAETACYTNHNKDGSVGIPFCKNAAAVFKPDSEEELPYNEIGEICFNTPSRMLGYVKNESETAKVIKTHKDGKEWIHTNDLGYIDEDGFVFIVGRIKRMIVRPDGHNVFPSAVEAVICSHPAVDSCSVVGKNAVGTNGKYPFSFVVLKPEYKGQEKEIQEEIEKLSLQKLPERDQAEFYRFIDQMPLTPIGKVDYRALEQQAESM